MRTLKSILLVLPLALFATTAYSNGNGSVTISSDGSSVKTRGHVSIKLGRVSLTVQSNGGPKSSRNLGLGHAGIRSTDGRKNLMTDNDSIETATAIDAQTERLEFLIEQGSVREKRIDYMIKKQNKIINRFEDAQADGIYTVPEHRKIAKLFRAQTSRMDAL